MESKITLLVALILLAGVVSRAALQGGISGAFTAKNGEKCKWHENRYGGGSGPRGLAISCNNIRKCEYKGNPHNCTWYNKKGNQPKFYNYLVEVVEAAQNACILSEISSKKKCPEIVMKKIAEQEMRYIEEEYYMQ